MHTRVVSVIPDHAGTHVRTYTHCHCVVSTLRSDTRANRHTPAMWSHQHIVSHTQTGIHALMYRGATSSNMHTCIHVNTYICRRIHTKTCLCEITWTENDISISQQHRTPLSTTQEASNSGLCRQVVHAIDVHYNY